MENNKNNKKENPRDNLRSKDLRTARAAIKKIKKEGKLEHIPDIIEALKLQGKSEIRKELHSLLRDIQTSGFQSFIVEAIKKPENEPILSDLLSVCWENKQDFSQYLNVFVSSFLVAEYKASLEAFTIIEKIFTDYDYSDDQLLKTIKTIKTSYPDFKENKKELTLVLLDSLESIKEN
jgi:hypothetical protein